MWPFTKKTKKKETVVEKKETEEKVFEEKRQKLCGEFVKKVNNMV